MFCTTALTSRFGIDEGRGRFLYKISMLQSSHSILLSLLMALPGRGPLQPVGTFCRRFIIHFRCERYRSTYLSSTSMISGECEAPFRWIASCFAWTLFLTPSVKGWMFGANGWMSVDGKDTNHRLDERLRCLWALGFMVICPPSKTTLNLAPPIASNDNVSFKSCLCFH